VGEKGEVVVLFNIFPWFIGADEVCNFWPVSKAMPVIKCGVLLQAFEQEKLLVGSPLVVEEGEVEFVQDMIFGGELLEIGEAGGAEVSVGSEQFGGLADIAFALVALYLVGRVHDVLGGGRVT